MDATGRDSRPSSWTARILAPVVLAVVFAAIVLVVTGSLSSDGEDEPEGGSGGQATNVGGCSDEARQALKDGYYVVEADDVEGLSGIAAKTCTTVERLERLNPNLDPRAIQVQNCIDLVPDGCKKLTG